MIDYYEQVSRQVEALNRIRVDKRDEQNRCEFSLNVFLGCFGMRDERLMEWR